MSNYNQICLTEYEAFNRHINVELFNDIISFVISTTGMKSTDIMPKVNFLTDNHLWFRRTSNSNVQEKYGFRYLGELLERFDERIGNDIKDIRAITLALAYSNSFTTKDMFVGNQFVHFITKIKKLSKDDIYLKGALYILDNNRYSHVFDELIIKKYEHTEDLIFALSLFNNFEKGFEVFKSQLVDLLGKSKNISVIHNIGIFNWIIKNLYEVKNKFKTKEMALFRAFILLPTSFVKNDSKPYVALADNGYSKEDIAYLNYAILSYKPSPDTLWSNGIVAEKIAIEFCQAFLNSTNTHSENTYDYLSETIKKYNEFAIKCYGYTGIIDAIKNNIRITNPQTFICLYKTIDKYLFSSIVKFDILDNKWDVLIKSLSNEDYLYLFDIQLVYNKYSRDQVIECINKYDNLTNSSYLQLFNESSNRHTEFEFLVEKNIINLKDMFIENNKEIPENAADRTKRIMLYIESAVMNIPTKEAFLFLEYFFSQYSILDIQNIFSHSFNFSDLYDCRNSYHYSRDNNLNIKRDFLSIEEHKQVLKWLDEYIFKICPSNYANFVIEVLKDDFIRTLFSEEELRQAYIVLKNLDPKIADNYWLKQKFLTQEELKADEKKKNLEEKRQRQLKRKKEFEETYNGTFESIHKFVSKWDYEESKFRCRLGKHILVNLLNNKNYILSKSEFLYVLRICRKLIEENVLTIMDFKHYISLYKEDSGNANNS